MSQSQKYMTQSQGKFLNILKNQKDLACPVCYYDYNNTNRIPMMLCSSQHNICNKCLKKIKKTQTKSQRKCPLCKQPMKNDYLKKNRLLSQIIQVFGQSRLQNGQKQMKNSNQQEFSDWESQATISRHSLDQQSQQNQLDRFIEFLTIIRHIHNFQQNQRQQEARRQRQQQQQERRRQQEQRRQIQQQQKQRQQKQKRRREEQLQQGMIKIRFKPYNKKRNAQQKYKNSQRKKNQESIKKQRKIFKKRNNQRSYQKKNKR